MRQSERTVANHCGGHGSTVADRAAEGGLTASAAGLRPGLGGQQGSAALNAPSHQIAGQFTQAAPAALMLSISPTQAEGALNALYELRVGNHSTFTLVV